MTQTITLAAFSSTRLSLDETVRAHLGAELRNLYGDPAETKLSYSLNHLLQRAAQTIRAHQEPINQAFVDGIMKALPKLRVFALSLARQLELAEDLVQETVLKAISKRESFAEGTNLQAWLFTILRNQFYTCRRSSSREVEDRDGLFAATLVSKADQEDKITIKELDAALTKLPSDQRKVLLLVGLEGVSYETAAASLGVRIGTVKSRLNRGRVRLAELMELETDDRVGGHRLGV
ncbi:MAG: sigma-70 family RNA polymerase sigma factor [Microvirga sp.]